MNDSEIIFILPHMSMGGAQKVVLQLVERLSKLGISTKIYILSNNVKSVYKTIGNDENVNFCICPFSDNKAVYFFYKFIWLFKNVNSNSIYVSFLNDANIILRIVSIFKKARYLYTVRNSPLEDVIGFPYNVIKLFLTSYPTVVFQSEFQRQNFKTIVHKSYVIPNYIVGDSQWVSRTEVYLPCKKFVLNVGRFEAQKCHYDYFEIARGNSDYEFILYGDGPLLSDYNKFLISEKISNVVVLSNKFDLSLLYKNAEWFILTSAYEGIPNVVLEALHYGCQVLCRNTPSVHSGLAHLPVNFYRDFVDVKVSNLIKSHISLDVNAYNEEITLKWLELFESNEW